MKTFAGKGLLATVVVGFGLMVITSEIEIVSPAQGFVEGNNNNTQIKSPSFGNVSQIFVSSGTQVKKGDPLIAFDNQDLIFKSKGLEKNAVNLKERLDREEKEICVVSKLLNVLEQDESSQLDDVMPSCGVTNDGGAKDKGVATAFIWKVRDYFDYKKHVGSLLKSTRSEVAIINKNIKIMKSKVSRLKKHNAVQLQIEDSQRELNAMTQSISANESEQTRLKIDISNKKTLIYNELADRLIRVTESLALTKADYDLNRYELDLHKLKIKRSTINSPISGVVLNLEENVGIDYYLEESEPIMLLKKNSENVVINAKFDTKYRGDIAVGMNVNIQPTLASFKGTIKGKITHISEDSFENKNKDGESRYYKVKVLPISNGQKLEEGTEVRVYAVGDTVSVFDYIMSVIVKNKTIFEPY